MKSVMIYSKSNIKKNRTNFLLLFLLISIAIALLISSVNSLFSYKETLLDKDKESNDVHNLYVVPLSEYRNELYDFWANDARTESVETEQAIYMNGATISDFSSELKVILANKDAERTIAPCILKEEDLSVDLSSAIYLPLYAKTSGMKLGDVYTVTYKSMTYEYQVAGFYELMHMIRPSDGFFRAYLSDEAMSTLESKVGKSVVTSVRLHDLNDGEQTDVDFLEYLKTAKIYALENADAMKTDITKNLQPIETPINVILMITIILALAIILICIVVIGFRIANNIEESIQENGILRACGFTGKQLKHAMVVEYLVLSVVSGCVGTAVSVPLQMMINFILQSASGVQLNLSVNMLIALISVVFITLFITFAANIFSRKIKKLTPVDAFKGGTIDKNFKGNKIPLGRGHGSLNWRLGVKGLFAYKKPYLISAVVLCVISIVLAVCTAFYSNMVADTQVLERMAGTEYGDIGISVAPYSNAYDLVSDIEEIEGVRKTTMMDAVTFDVEDLVVTGYLSDDFSQYEVFLPQSGKFPASKNEIALTTHLAGVLNKKIGDMVSVSISGMSADFLVTGFFTSASAGSRFAMITEEGYRQAAPEYQRGSINVYLENGYTVDEIIDTISEKHGVLNSYDKDSNTQYAKTRITAEEKISNYMNFYGVNSVNYAVMHNGEVVLSGSTGKYQISDIRASASITDDMAKTYGTPITLVLVLFSVSAILTTFIILRVLINTLTNKRKEEITILRAVGFTSKQLAFQFANSFLPAVLFGTLIGSVVGSFTVAPLLFRMMFNSIGISDVNVAASPVFIVIISVALTAIAYFAALSSVYKIKKRSIVKALQTAMILIVAGAIIASVRPHFVADAAVETDSGSSEDVYPIASISKMYTTAAVMKLVDEGLIDLDTPIVEYFPEFVMADDRYVEITARMLLNHSAGLAGTSGLNGMLLGDKSEHERAKQSFMDTLSQQTLRHTPGERSIYCNDGFTLAEYLVERVSGLSFTDFLQQNFFDPLGLKNTGTVENNYADLDLMPSYIAGLKTQTEIVYFIGSGGIYASAEDVCRFSKIFTNDYSDGLLSRESLDETALLQHPGKMVPDEAETNMNYGLGWDAVDIYPFAQLGIKALSKNGNLTAANSNLVVLPDYNISVAVIASGGHGDSKESIIANEIALAFVEEMGIAERPEMGLPQLAAATAIPEDVKQYAGFYDFGSDFLAEIAFTENSLTITAYSSDQTRTTEFLHIGNGEFASTESGAELLGQSTAAGGVNSFIALSFLEDMNDVVHVVGRSYLDAMGIGTLANHMPIAQKIETVETPAEVLSVWQNRSEYDYLLTNAKYSSESYITTPVVRFHIYDQISGYIGAGNENGTRSGSSNAVILDENEAVHTQNIPTLNGSNTSSLTFADDEDVLIMKGYRYVSTKNLQNFSESGSTMEISSEALWFKIDSESAKGRWDIQHGEDASFFVYDENFNCVNHSLVAESSSQVLLPEDGYICFVSSGLTGDFTISRVS